MSKNYFPSIEIQRARKATSWEFSQRKLEKQKFNSNWSAYGVTNDYLGNKFNAHFSYLVFGTTKRKVLAMWAPIIHTAQELQGDYVLVKCIMQN